MLLEAGLAESSSRAPLGVEMKDRVMPSGSGFAGGIVGFQERIQRFEDESVGAGIFDHDLTR